MSFGFWLWVYSYGASMHRELSLSAIRGSTEVSQDTKPRLILLELRLIGQWQAELDGGQINIFPPLHLRPFGQFQKSFVVLISALNKTWTTIINPSLRGRIKL